MSEFEEKLNSLLSSPEELSKIMNIAKEISGSMNSENKSQENVDLFNMKRLIKDDKRSQKEELLLAIKPYVKSERQEDIEKAIKLIKLLKIAKMFLKEEGGGVV